MSNANGSGVETEMIFTLIDVFKIIKKDEYPLLWKSVLLVLSFLPTTVACEQSFSRLKHKMHQNMDTENAFNVFQASQREAECNTL